MGVFGGDAGQLERTGFAGLLAEEAEDERPVESPVSWAPVGVSHGAVDDGHRVALARFQAWLAEVRESGHP